MQIDTRFIAVAVLPYVLHAHMLGTVCAHAYYPCAADNLARQKVGHTLVP
jgi:hypothetical protein